MLLSSFFAGVFLCLATLCRADGLLEAASKIPQCGLQCILESVPLSPCGTIANQTCLCTDETLYAMLMECVGTHCSVPEALETGRISSTTCNKPIRSRRTSMFIALAVEMIAVLCVLTRLFSRWWLMSHFDVDDILMILVTILYIVFEALGLAVTLIAFGVDIWTVEESELTLAQKIFYVDESFYLVVLNLTKVSILIFYLRVFPNPNFRKIVYGIMAWIISSSVIFLFLQIFQCWPIEYNWKGWKGDYGPHQCLDINVLSFVSAAFSIAQDLAIAIAPIPILIKLNTTWKIRIGIIFMFSLGIFVLITSCIRLRSIVTFGSSKNPTWDYADTLIWTGLELAVSMIVTSLPAIRALILRIWSGKSRGTYASGTGGSHVYGARQTPPGKQSSRSTEKHSRISRHDPRGFSVLSSSDADAGSELELGDKGMGHVATEITGERGQKKPHIRIAPMPAEGIGRPSRRDDGSPDSLDLELGALGTSPRIHVQTTMSRTSTAVAGRPHANQNWSNLGR